MWNRHLIPIPTPIPITAIPTPIPIPITTIPTSIPTPPKRIQMIPTPIPTPESESESSFDSDSGVGIAPGLTHCDTINTFSTLSLNCRSLSKKIDKLECSLKSLNHQFHCIGLTETWLKEMESTVTPSTALCLLGY